MRNTVRKLLPVAIVFIATAAQAQWSGKAELGVLLSNGNTESKSANGKLDMTHEGSQWRNNFYAAALYGENAEFANAERYELRYQADWKITDRFSWFVGILGEQEGDPVATLGSNYEHAFTESTKITNKFLSEIGSDNTSVQDDLALQVNVNLVDNIK